MDNPILENKLKNCEYRVIEKNIPLNKTYVFCDSPFGFCEYLGETIKYEGKFRKKCEYPIQE